MTEADAPILAALHAARPNEALCGDCSCISSCGTSCARLDGSRRAGCQTPTTAENANDRLEAGDCRDRVESEPAFLTRADHCIHASSAHQR